MTGWRALGVLIALALALRALVAIVLAPGSGFRPDLIVFENWARDLASNGPGAFYRPGAPHYTGYPPGFLYLLWLVGLAGPLWEAMTGSPNGVASLLKVPVIAADLLAGMAVYVLGRVVAGPRVGIVAAAIFLLDPSVVLASTIWGQNDSVGSFVLLLGLIALAKGSTEGPAGAAVLAPLVKFQFGILAPVVGVTALGRHVLRPLRDGGDLRRGLLRLAASAVLAILVLWVVIAPFGLVLIDAADPAHSLAHRLGTSAGGFFTPTVSAFNIWMNPVTGLFQPDGIPKPGYGMADWIPVVSIAGFGVAPLTIAVGLFLAISLAALAFLLRRDDPRALVLVTFVIASAFFFVLTRVHERYLYAALPLAAVLAATRFRWAGIYVCFSALFTLNVYWAYFLDPRSEGLPRSAAVDATLFSPTGVYLISFAGVAAFVVSLVFAYRELRSAPTT